MQLKITNKKRLQRLRVDTSSNQKKIRTQKRPIFTFELDKSTHGNVQSFRLKRVKSYLNGRTAQISYRLDDTLQQSLIFSSYSPPFIDK